VLETTFERILAFDAEHCDDDDQPRRFLLYCQAMRGLLLMYLQNSETIYKNILEWNGFDGFRAYLAERPDLVALRKELEALKDQNLAENRHHDVFSALQKTIMGDVAAAEAFFADKQMTDLPPAVEKKISKAVEHANRNDPNASLTVPLLFWSLSDEHYKRVIQSAIPWPVRVLLCNTLFWRKGKEIAEFCPHYRNNWAI